jgi:cytochrome c-type biogenesis protein CcmE
VVGIVLLAAIGFVLYKGLTSALVYFKTANEAVADRAQLGNSTFQLEGIVVRGSVRQLGGGRVAFTVEGGGASVPVVNTGEPPQLFRAGIPVVVVGHFVGTSNEFASDQILVKHSNQYIAAHPGRVTVPASDTGTVAGN